MTNAPTPAGGREFSGKAVLAVLGMISVVMAVIVVWFSQRDVGRAMDERSEEAIVFEGVAHSEKSMQPVADDEPGWWRCGLIVVDPDRDSLDFSWDRVTFALWLPTAKDDRPAYIRNGEEFIPADAQWDGPRLELSFPHFDSKISASSEGLPSGQLTGIWWKSRPSGIAEMDFEATSVDRFSQCYQGSNPETPVRPIAESEWSEPEIYRMQFKESGIAKGVFRTARLGDIETHEESSSLDGAYVWKGTILTPTGDYRYLYGKYDVFMGAKMGYMTVFDGAHAFLFNVIEGLTPKAQRDFEMESGISSGAFYSGNTWHETFTATRLPLGEDFDLPDAFSEIGLKPGETKLHLPQLDDPKYAGKAVIVKVMGTWCPNCHDATRLLVEYYDEYHDDGLEILGLAYEHTLDEARSLRQIARFKERLGATWEIIPAGLSDKQKTAATLPALTDIKSYPTTIFLNRDHTVEAIHSGFSGPATGAAHEEVRAEFARLIEVILGS